jgi:hypothetical protein
MRQIHSVAVTSLEGTIFVCEVHEWQAQWAASLQTSLLTTEKKEKGTYDLGAVIN